MRAGMARNRGMRRMKMNAGFNGFITGILLTCITIALSLRLTIYFCNDKHGMLPNDHDYLGCLCFDKPPVPGAHFNLSKGDKMACNIDTYKKSTKMKNIDDFHWFVLHYFCKNAKQCNLPFLEKYETLLEQIKNYFPKHAEAIYKMYKKCKTSTLGN